MSFTLPQSESNVSLDEGSPSPSRYIVTMTILPGVFQRLPYSEPAMLQRRSEVSFQNYRLLT